MVSKLKAAVADCFGTGRSPCDIRPLEQPQILKHPRNAVTSQSVRKHLSVQEQSLWDERLLGRSWVEIAAARGLDPDVVRIQCNRALERACGELTPT